MVIVQAYILAPDIARVAAVHTSESPSTYCLRFLISTCMEGMIYDC